MHRATPSPPALTTAGALCPQSLPARVRLGVGVAALSLGAGYADALLRPAARPLDVLGVVLLLASAAFLLGRDLAYPRALGACAAAAVYVGSGYPVLAAWPAPAVALAAAVQVGAVRRVAPLGVVAVLAAVAGSQFGRTPFGATEAVVGLVLVAAVVSGADALRMRVRVETARAKYAEHGRQRRLADERVRIVRDVHGHVGSELARISRRARLARHLIDTYDHRAPVEARAALEDLSTRGAEALEELRVVTVLLDGEPTESMPRNPPRGLAGLSELLLVHLETGLEVAVGGAAPRLPRAVDQAAYEVVKAALDNVARHSTAVRAGLSLQVERAPGGDRIVVEVRDDGPARSARSIPGTPGISPGGLADVRSRVTMLGGTLSAGPDGEGGWTVRAAIPVRG